MKRITVVLIGVPIALGLGFVVGWVAGPKPDHTQVQAYFNCYDSQGNLVQDKFFENEGGLITQCGSGMLACTTRILTKHIELTELERRRQ